MSIRDEPPEPGTPRCPECCGYAHVVAATVEEQRWGHNWYCESPCRTYFTGSPLEYVNWQARKLARAAERGELDEAHRAGQNQGVLGAES